MKKSFLLTSETPPKHFTPLFGEVENHQTLTENHDHKGHNDSKV